MQKNLVIQALRGIAAIAVVIFHCSALLDNSRLGSRHAVFGPLASGGVDLFFLISGYIIATSVSRLDHGWSSSGSFFLKRLIRIWPPYAIATAIFCLAFALKNPTIPSLSDVSRSLLFIQLDYAAPYYGFAALVVGWTLNYEFFFYAIVAAGLVTRHRWVFVLAFFLIALVFVPLWIEPELTFAQLMDAERAYANAWVFTNPLCWLFMIGVAVHFVEQRKLMIQNGLVVTILIVSSLMFLVACYLMPEMNKHGLTGMGLAVTPIFLVCVLARKRIEKHIPKSLVYLGDVSFSVYLTHVITLSLVNAALARYTDKGIILMLFAICISIMGGALYFKFIERPLTRLLTPKTNRRSSRPATIVT